jgi:hypothetical protein
MSFVTFMYRIGSSRRTYFGKYVFSGSCGISDDHEGLDTQIVTGVLNGINRFRTKNNKEKLSLHQIKVGILAFCPNDNFIPVYSSDDEIGAFDFYHLSSDVWTKNPKIYINGKIV